MRGVVGEFRWDGGPAGGEAMPWGAGEIRRHRPAQAVAVGAWGAPHRAAWLGWHEQPDAGLLAVADITLYGADHLQNALGVLADGSSPAGLLLHAWQRWGEGMLAHLDGDYAFVIVDLHRQQLFAATDPMGVRPLFFRHRQAQGMAFASTPEALARWLGLDDRIPERRLLEPLFDAEQLAHLQPEIAGVERLPGGHAMAAGPGRCRVWRWWRPGQCRAPGLAATDTTGWVEGLRWHVAEAVRKRVADGVRAGVAFSGGLDSSAVLALAHAQAPTQVKAFSLRDGSNPVCPETRAIDIVLSATGVAVSTINTDDEAAAAQARAVVARLPRFILGRSGFLGLFEATAAAEGGEVMMNGLDADALFFYEDLPERLIRSGRSAEAWRQARLQDAMGLMPWMQAEIRRLRWTSWLPWWLRERIRDVRGRVERMPRLRAAFLNDATIARFGLRERVGAYLSSLRDPPPPADGVPTETVLSLTVQDGVARFQRRGRCLGLEMRSPFLDRALIEFAVWIPLELRLRDGHLKWILRQAIAPLLPPAVTWRGDKLHLGSHFDRVMLQPVLEGLIRDFRGSGPAIAPYVDRQRVLAQAERWQAGALDAVWQLKELLLLEWWLQHNADRVARDC